LKINYDQLSEELTELEPEEVKKAHDKLTGKLQDLNNTLLKIQAPNMKVSRWN